MRLFSLTPTEHAPHDAHLSDGPEQFFSFFANDVGCQAVTGRLPREQGRNELFHDLLVTNNTELLGGFNLDEYFPSLAAKHRKRWDDLLDGLIDKHASKTVDGEHEEDFIDVLLSVQQEYSLTRDNIKAILMVCM